jgi:molybdopterin-guanine dinucleotide biosynthesis protein MobB
MKPLHIIGRKNSGKTTLIVELIGELTARGYSVGTIKHTHHRHELDTPGKDSHRHRRAGASVVGILSPAMNAVFWPNQPWQSSRNRYDDFAGMFAECDLVLVEGDAGADAPKVEVWRAATGTVPLAATDARIKALITDDPLAVDVPVWRRSHVPHVADELLQLMGYSKHALPWPTSEWETFDAPLEPKQRTCDAVVR